jgi:hypothetical protein
MTMRRPDQMLSGSGRWTTTPLCQRVWRPSEAFYGAGAVLRRVTTLRLVRAILAVTLIPTGITIVLADPVRADEVFWLRAMYTTDDDHAGAMEWRPAGGSGTVKVCDEKDDDYLVRVKVTLENSTLDSATAIEGDGNCSIGSVPPVLNRSGDQKYLFEICLVRRLDDREWACNETDSASWPKNMWPDGKPPCHKVPSWYTSDDPKKNNDLKKCVLGEDITAQDPMEPVRPPAWRPGNPNARPDDELRHGRAAPPKVGEPLYLLLDYISWLVWAGCMAGFIIVGGKMAIKHKRGEAGAHATGMAWVLIACAVTGSSLATGLIALLIRP